MSRRLDELFPSFEDNARAKAFIAKMIEAKDEDILDFVWLVIGSTCQAYHWAMEVARVSGIQMDRIEGIMEDYLADSGWVDQ